MFFVVKNQLVNLDEIKAIDGRVQTWHSGTKTEPAFDSPTTLPDSLPCTEIWLSLRSPSKKEIDLRGEKSEEFLNQIDNLHFEDRNRLFSKEAQVYLGNLLIEKDRKQKELDNA